MKLVRSTTAYLALALLLLIGFAHGTAAQTYQINYQGKITDTTGAAVADGLYNITFALYTQASGGTAVWTETRTGGDQVQVTNGLFSVMLGEVTSLSGVDFTNTLYLGVNFNSDGEMTPRKLLGAVPAAFEAQNAETLGGIATSSFLRADEADTATGLLTFTSGLISSASSTITELTTGTTTVTTLVVDGQAITSLTGTGLTNIAGTLSLDATGDWTGTFDGQEGSYYLNRANHTGTQLLSTISDAGTLAALDDLSTFTTDDLAEGLSLYFTNSRARSAISETITGITYTPGTGVFSLTAGYEIPLSASTTAWNDFYNTPSTRITAGTNLSWSGNTLNASFTDTTLTQEEVQDFVGTMVTGNTESGITVTYDDAGNHFDFTVANLQDLAGTLDVASGGTGATTAAGARTNLGLGSLATLSTITTSEITNGTIAAADLNLTDITLLDFTNDAGFITDANDTVQESELDDVFAGGGTGIVFFDDTTDTVSASGTIAALYLDSALALDTDVDDLSGVTNAAGARTNLGLGALATLSSIDISSNTNLAVGNGITLTGDTLTVTAAGGLAQTTGGLTTTGVLEDLNTTGAATGADQFLVSTAAGVLAWESGATARTSLGLGSLATLSTITNANITNGTILDDDLNLTDITLADFTNDAGFITSADDTVSGTELDGVFSGNGFLRRTGAATYTSQATIDISADTNLGVSATGLSLSGDSIALTAGYEIPLSASTTAWNDFYNTPSSRITAGTNLSWSGNTLNASFTDTTLTQEQVQDFVGTMVTGNTETGITVTYDDAGNHFDFTVANLQDLAGTLDVASGGTGATTAAGARTSLGLGSLATLSSITNVQLTAGTFSNITGTGALNAGSITSGFGNINIGASTFTTTGAANFGTINTGAPALYTAITSAVNAPVMIGELNTAAGGFAPMIHGRTLITGGFRKHVSIGAYRTGSGWNGGIYFGQGGNDNNPTEYFLMEQGGILSHSLGAITIAGAVNIPSNTDFGAGIDVTGNITVTGTVDGRDIATDGSKLDGIEAGATGDQTATEIRTALLTVDGAGSGLDADLLDGLSSASFLQPASIDTSAELAAILTNETGTGNAVFSASPTFTGTASFTNTTATRYLGPTDTYAWLSGDTDLYLDLDDDNDSASNLFVRDGANSVIFQISEAGNVTLTGTVDGRDVAADGTKLDGIEAGATGDQTATEIRTALLTVDGAGSGLDADLLDGVNSTQIPYALTSAGGGALGTTNTFITDGGIGADNITRSMFFRDNNNQFGALGIHIQHSNNVNYALQIASPSYSGGALQYRHNNNGTWTSPETIWSTANDGAGSGLDADLLDGLSSASFLQPANIDTSAELAAILTNETGTGNVVFSASPTFTGTITAATINATALTGAGSGITALNASQLTTGTIPDARISGAYTGLTNLTGSGNVDFSRFLGNAADTAAAPSFSWTGDLNTGVYQPGADQIGLSTAGAARLTISAAGVVNIPGLSASRLIATDGSDNLVSTISEANLEASVSGVTNIFTNNDTITAANIVDSFVLNTSDTMTGNLTVNGFIAVDEIRTQAGTELVINGGDSAGLATGQTGELVYINAEGGLQINSSPDNWTTGWAARHTATLVDTAGNSSFPGSVTATSFSGSGASLTALNASQLTSGTIPDARISGSYTGMTNLTGTGNVDFSRFLGNAADTAAAPSFSWTGDLNTGVYQPGADQIGLSTAGSARLTISAAGVVNIPGNTDFGAGIDVTGNITVTGTVDGRDIAADGTKLDGIEAGATAVDEIWDIDGQITGINVDTAQPNRWWAYVHSTGGSGTYPTNYVYISSLGGSQSRGTQIASSYGGAHQYYIRRGSDNLGAENGANTYQPWHNLWTSGNDGAGSGLDADLLDGLSSASFLQPANIDTSAELAAILTNETGTGSVVFSAAPSFTGEVSVTGSPTSYGVAPSSGYRTIMGTGSSATWLAYGESANVFRGGVQLLDSGGVMRLYANSGYIQVDSSSNLTVPGANITLGSTNLSEADLDALDDGLINLATEVLGTLPSGNFDRTGNWTGTLDGIDGSQFLRSDVSDTAAGLITFNSGITLGNVLTNTAVNSRDKLRVWSSGSYTIGMTNGFTFGGIVNDYAMTFQMNNQSTRGFWWGDDTHTGAQGAMALTTDGRLTVANSMRLGYGEGDTTAPGTVTFDVSGTGRFTGNLDANAGLDVTGNITVTGTVDGRDVAADGTKLDGIEAGATGDQTATEIRTALLTVDGSGSGIDADLLDGLSSASFLQPSSIDTSAELAAILTNETGTGNVVFSASPTFTGTITAATINATTLTGAGSGITALNASQLTSGTIPDARISGSYTGMTNLTGTGNVDFSRFLGNAADTAAAPSFSWTGDLNTGVYQPGADQIGLSTAGSARLTISAAGVVNIPGSLTLGTALAVAEGGTGATTAAGARTNLGLGSLATLSSITNAQLTAGTFSNITGTGALNAGSITSGFGNINIGASTFTTTGAVSVGNLNSTGNIITSTGGSFGSFDSGQSIIYKPAGASLESNAALETGAIKVALPNSWTNTMMRMRVEVYDYTTNESFTVMLGGYNFSGGPSWVNTFAQIIANKADRDFNVRFGHDGTVNAIWIGETSSTWSFPKVVVTEFIAGHSNDAVSQWDDGWDISIDNSFTGDTITSTQSNNLINQWIATGNNIYNINSGNIGIGIASPSFKLDVAGTGRFTGNLDANAGLDVTGNITVTGTVDGRDVAADGTKLDGIEAGATGDQTATEIRTALLTVDGSGSGIDADLLDGLSSASFLQPSSIDTSAELAAILTNETGTGNVVFSASPTFTGTITAATINATTLTGAGSGITALNASQLTTGTIPDARISGSYTGMTNLTGTGNVDFSRFLGNAADTAAAPSFSWTGDLNTGIYQPGADQIGLSTAGAARLTISAAGVVNIPGNTDFGAGIDVTGNITVTGTVDGRDVAADGTKLDGIEAGATGDQTATEIRTALLTVDGSGSGIDADLLDGRQATGFLNYNTGGSIDVNSALGTVLQMGSTGSWTNRGPAGSNAGGILSLQTHPGNYYSQLWFDTSGGSFYHRTANNALPTGTWREVWDEGNDGVGSGLDADLLDGLNLVQGAATANSVAGRDGAGDIYTRLIRQTFASAASVNGGASIIMRVNDSTDNYLRPITGAGFVDWLEGFDGAGSGLDADVLDGITSGSFLRSDASDTYSGGILTAQNNAGIGITTSLSSINGLQVFQPTSGADALMTFHIGSDYAVHFGLDGGINDLVVGGWSMGANSYRIWHQGNDGAGSGLDADTLDGINSSSFLTSTAGNWTGTLDGIDGSQFLRSNVADTATGQITMSAGLILSGTASNIQLGSNYLSGDGGDEGISVDANGNVFAAQDQLYVCAGGACASTANGDGTITAERAITTEERSLATAGSITVNWDDGNQQRISGSTGNMTINFSNQTAGQTLRLVICFGGAHTVTWTPTIRWAGGTAPTPTSASGKCDVFSFLYTGSDYFGQSSLNF